MYTQVYLTLFLYDLDSGYCHNITLTVWSDAFVISFGSSQDLKGNSPYELAINDLGPSSRELLFIIKLALDETSYCTMS